MSLGHWVGRRAAEVVMVFRDKPFVPCQVDWYEPDPLDRYVEQQRQRIQHQRELEEDLEYLTGAVPPWRWILPNE